MAHRLADGRSSNPNNESPMDRGDTVPRFLWETVRDFAPTNFSRAIGRLREQ
ncbi:MAG: hypothetical protein AABN34_13315 [Acidobacteriota bacterium]